MTPSVALRSVAVLAAVGAAGWVAYRGFAARRVAVEADQLSKVLALEETSRVADVGAGGGEYARELASRIVPRGHVFATEIEKGDVAKLRTRAESAQLGNLTVVLAAETSANLPEACCDAIFLRGVYHHITKPAETNQSLRVALRPKGRMAIVDFEPSWFLSTFFPVSGVPANRGGHGVPPSIVVNELEQAGFRLIDRLDTWADGQYCLVFQSPE